MDYYKDLIVNKGLLIAIFTAITKGIFQIRKRDFNAIIFICDLFLALPVGYVWWEVGADAGVNGWLLVFTTIVMSGNAFSILLFIFNPDTAKRILDKWVVIDGKPITQGKDKGLFK